MNGGFGIVDNSHSILIMSLSDMINDYLESVMRTIRGFNAESTSFNHVCPPS